MSGEWIDPKPANVSRAPSVLSRTRTPSLVALDLLRRDGDDLRLWPIEARRETLMKLVAKRRNDGIVYSESLTGEGALV
jgi:ATP-dependent DNA ligase